MLMVDLARIGVFSWVIPVVQVVSVIAAVVFTVAQPNLDDVGTRALMAALLAPYLVTWIAIGVRLAAYRGLETTHSAQTSPAGSNRLQCGRCGQTLSPFWRERCGVCKTPFSEFPPVSVAP